MPVTISRLYDNPTDAQRAVARLEAAGVPHSDISIVANNSDSWFSSDKKVDRDHDGVDDRAEGAGKGAGIGAGVGGAAGLLAGWVCLPSPDSGLWSQPVGWPQLRSARQQEQRPAVSSVLSLKQAFQKRMLTPTRKASGGEARWYRRGSPMRIVPVSTRS